MRLLPKKYRFNKVAYVNAEGRPTSLQTGEYRVFDTFTVWAYSESSAIKKAAKKCKGLYSAEPKRK